MTGTASGIAPAIIKASPFTQVVLRISTDRSDFEDLCAQSGSYHKSFNLNNEKAEDSSEHPGGCESLGDGAERVGNPIRH